MTSMAHPVEQQADDGGSVAAVLARVDAMVADGDSLAAIGWLAEQNRRRTSRATIRRP